jgi:hypothetical protein
MMSRMSDLKVGAKVFIVAAKQPDGTARSRVASRPERRNAAHVTAEKGFSVDRVSAKIRLGFDWRFARIARRGRLAAPGFAKAVARLNSAEAYLRCSSAMAA